LGAEHKTWLSWELEKLAKISRPALGWAVEKAVRVILEDTVQVIHDHGACAFVQDVMQALNFATLQFTSYEPIETHVPLFGPVNISVNSTKISTPTSMTCQKAGFNGTALTAVIDDIPFGASFVWAYQKMNSSYWHNKGSGFAKVVAGTSLHIDVLQPSLTALKVRLPTLKLDLHADAHDWMYHVLTMVMSPLLRISMQGFGGEVLAHFIKECLADPTCPQVKAPAPQPILAKILAPSVVIV